VTTATRLVCCRSLISITEWHRTFTNERTVFAHKLLMFRTSQRLDNAHYTSLYCCFVRVSCLLLAEKIIQCLSAFWCYVKKSRCEGSMGEARRRNFEDRRVEVDCTNFQARSYIETQFTDKATRGQSTCALVNWLTSKAYTHCRVRNVNLLYALQ